MPDMNTPNRVGKTIRDYLPMAAKLMGNTTPPDIANPEGMSNTQTMPEGLGNTVTERSRPVDKATISKAIETLKKYKDGIVTGELPELKLVAALDGPTAFGAERVALYDVTLDEVTLSKFENKGLVEEEVPFKAGSFELLDLV